MALAGAFLAACSGDRQGSRAPYVPLDSVEAVYGPLIGGGNYATPDQHGTGERIGLFRDASGTLWGLPLLLKDGAMLACAPLQLRDAPSTDTVSAGFNLIGSTNEPTGWRGGTGNLELLLRDPNGSVHSQPVHGAEFPSGPMCWAPEKPGPPQRLRYYRIVPTSVLPH
jgi:hypothetical protein